MKNVEDVLNLLEQWEELQEMAAPIATQLIALGNPRINETIEPDEIVLEYGVLCAHWETYCCGEADNHTTAIPLDYLFDDDWQEYAKNQIEEEKEAERKKKERERLQAEQRRKDAERKRYLELKAKYEGGAS